MCKEKDVKVHAISGQCLITLFLSKNTIKSSTSRFRGIDFPILLFKCSALLNNISLPEQTCYALTIAADTAPPSCSVHT